MDGDAIARTSGGAIHIEDVTGSVEARSSGRSIIAHLSRQPRDTYRLSTSGGNIEVLLEDGVMIPGVDLTTTKY